MHGWSTTAYLHTPYCSLTSCRTRTCTRTRTPRPPHAHRMALDGTAPLSTLLLVQLLSPGPGSSLADKFPTAPASDSSLGLVHQI
eukprot:1157799-Pelagomonas_calceolata.AAC.5